MRRWSRLRRLWWLLRRAVETGEGIRMASYADEAAVVRSLAGIPGPNHPPGFRESHAPTSGRWAPIYGEGPDPMEEARRERERSKHRTGLILDDPRDIPPGSEEGRRALETALSWWYRELFDECEDAAEGETLRRLTERAARAMEEGDGA